MIELTDAKIRISKNASLCWILANWVTNVIVAQRLNVYCEQVWLGLLFNQFPCVTLRYKFQTMFRCYTL